jgi:hypothetical protein
VLHGGKKHPLSPQKSPESPLRQVCSARTLTIMKKTIPSVTASSFPERCAILIHGHNVEVPAFFKAWIYDNQPNENNQEPPNNLRDILGTPIISETEGREVAPFIS